MKFLLKKKHGYISNFSFCLNTSIFLSLSISVYLFFIQPYFGSNIELSFHNFFQYTAIIFLSIIFIFWLLNILIDKYREKMPYNIENIVENNKKYAVKYFPIEGCRKFTYKGKLHRESGAAIEYVNSGRMGSKFLNQYYWQGKKIDEKDISLYIKQERINQF